MNAVVINVSKGKSMVAIMRPFGEIVSTPFEIKHTTSDNNSLVKLINSIDCKTRILMKLTGRHYEVLDQTYPGVNTYFDSPARSESSQKWVDFAPTYWHVDCVRKLSLNAFLEYYQNCCKRKKYNFSKSKAEEIYEKLRNLLLYFLRMTLQNLSSSRLLTNLIVHLPQLNNYAHL